MVRPRMLRAVVVLCSLAMGTGMGRNSVLAGPVILSNNRTSVTVDEKTGRVLGMTDGKRLCIAGNADVYTLSSGAQKIDEGRARDVMSPLGLSTDSQTDETKDIVIASKVTDNSATLQCRNSEISWLEMEKSYTLSDTILSKKVRYKARSDSGKLFVLQSKVSLDKSVKVRGAYYFPMDDGYKASGPAVLEDCYVNRRVNLDRSNAMVTYAMPDRHTVLGHYLYRINGKIAYCGWPAVPAFLDPDGWTAGMACEFLSPSRSLEVETHLTLVDGDARDFHLQYYSLPEFAAFRKIDAPPWTRDVVLWAGGLLFWDVADPLRDTTPEKVRTYGLLKRTARMRSSEKDVLYTVLTEPSPTGDYPFADPVHYFREKTFNHALPLKDYLSVIRNVEASAPNLKPSVYTSRGAVVGDWTFVKEHPEWLVYNPDGTPRQGGGGLGLDEYIVDITAPGYQEYALEQYKRILDVLGVKWIYIDGSPQSYVNWKAKRVVTTADWVEFFQKIHEICRERDAFLWLNSGWASVLCADMGLFENYSIPQMEKQDWRKLAYISFMSKLTRLRPTGHAVMQGVMTPYYYHSGGYGIQMVFLGGVGVASVPSAAAAVRMSAELFDAVSVPLKVSPSWWDGDDTDLEVGVLKKGRTFILPLIWHGDTKARRKVSLETGQLGFAANAQMFVLETGWAIPYVRDITKALPDREDVTDIRALESMPAYSGTLNHATDFDPLSMRHLVLTDVPGFVYSAEGERPYLLLADNKGVRISGTAPADCARYEVEIASDAETAQVLLWAPKRWKGAAARLNGAPSRAGFTKVGEETFLLVSVPKGVSRVSVEEGQDTASPIEKISNPQIDSWAQIVGSFYYYNLDFAPVRDDGRLALDLKLQDKEKGGGSFVVDLFEQVQLDIHGGMEFSVRGEGKGGELSVDFEPKGAAPVWKAPLDFMGWKTFTLSGPAWKEKQYIRFALRTEADNASLRLADLRFLPETKDGKEARQPETKRVVVARRTKSPPAMNSVALDDCWDGVEYQSSFYSINGGKASDWTGFKVCYDGKAMYLLIENRQPIVEKEAKCERDGEIWRNDTDEIYIAANPAGKGYVHFMCDSGGNQYDARTDPILGVDKEWDGKWSVLTSLGYNVSWRAKVQIPFSDLDAVPKPGDRWAFNVTRSVRGGELSSWSLMAGTWHDPARFGVIEFAQ